MMQEGETEGGEGGREIGRENNSSCSRNIKNKSVLYNYSNIKLQEIRRYNNDGLRSARVI